MDWKPSKPHYVFCLKCGNKAWIDDDHEQHSVDSSRSFVDINGIYIVENFIRDEEEKELVSLIDLRTWIPSQEGRAKQDYGPKVSFLKKKASIGNFNGFPDFAVNLFDRMQLYHSSVLGDFVPVEFCILEYKPERGSYIRPHYDDKWVWGDRLITINLLSDTVLRLTREYNIPPYEIVIKMPRKSLLILAGEARYDWHHSINRYDIKSRRIAMTWREFSEEIVSDEEYKEFVREVFAISNQVEIVTSGS